MLYLFPDYFDYTKCSSYVQFYSCEDLIIRAEASYHDNGDWYYFTSPHIDAIATQGETSISSVANGLVAIFNGVNFLLHGSPRFGLIPITFDKYSTSLLVDEGTILPNEFDENPFKAPIITTDSHVFRSLSKEGELFKLARENVDVRELLILIGLTRKSHQIKTYLETINSWSSLYKIYDSLRYYYIKHEKITEKDNLCKNEQVDRFHRVCNSWHSIGINNRHGQKSGDNNNSKITMKLDEAIELFYKEIKNYIRAVYPTLLF